MRAGGVGGVAWMQTGAAQSYSYGTGSGEVHVPLADHMGNVRHYYQFKASGSNVTGQLVASYEYDAFGREVRAWGLNTPTENQPPGLPASRPWADLLPFHYSSKLRDVDSGFNYYGYRFYDPGAGRWLNRDPMGEEGGDNLYGFNYNMPTGLVDVLGREPMPVDSGSWVPARDSRETAHFHEVSDATSDPGHSSQANSGLDMIKRLKEDSKNNCCVKNYTIAGHGWRSDLDDDGKSVRPRGSGIPGNQKGPDGVGLYVNDNYPGMDKTRGGASLDDIAREIKSGGIKFCRPCTISIHSCYIDDSFISKLRDITKCTVVAAGGKCDGGAGGRPWRSGPTDHPKDDRRTPQNGFRRAGMGKTVVLPTVPIGPKYTPPAP
jgi:RHS repeat-associated protein